MDLGCGPGVPAGAATEAGCDALGVDASPAVVEPAPRHAPRATFRVGPLLDAVAVTATGGP